MKTDMTFMTVCLIHAIFTKKHQNTVDGQNGYYIPFLPKTILRINPSFEGNIICPVNTPTSEMDSVPLLRWSRGQKEQSIWRHKISSNTVSCSNYLSIPCIAVC
jgi:hypothetical protein